MTGCIITDGRLTVRAQNREKCTCKRLLSGVRTRRGADRARYRYISTRYPESQYASVIKFVEDYREYDHCKNVLKKEQRCYQIYFIIILLKDKRI